MSNYKVGCKVTIYYDIEVEASDNWSAEEKALETFSDMLDKVNLPSPLEFDSMEVWDVEVSQ